MRLIPRQGLVLALLSVLLISTESPAEHGARVFQPGFHQALRWSVTTTGRTTYRMKVPVGRPGSRLRFAFRSGEGPLTIHAASVALAGTRGALASAPLPISFQGARAVSLPAGARRVSDAVDFPVAFGTELYISFDVEGALAAGAIMTFPDSFKYPGANADVANPSGATPWMRAIGLDVIDVEAPSTRAFVALGDSITEGYVSGDVWDYVSKNDDYRNAWAMVAQRQLRVPIANAGVGGQGIQDAIANLETEVFTLSGISDCLVLLGTNDLPMYGAPELQAQLETLFSRLRPWCRIWAGTMLPKERTPTGDLATVNVRRRAVNDWLRTQANVTGVIDFAAVTASPTNPDVFRAGFNADGVHTSIQGQAAMGQEVARVLVEPGPGTFDDVDADRVLSVARQQLARTASVMATTQSPKSTRADGTWTTVANTNLIGWTQGFFPGSMWLLHQAGGEPIWRTRADQWTRSLELQKTNTQTHDLGFKFIPSFGSAHHLTGDPYYRGVALTAARSLATRFNSTVGIIDCCDWNEDWEVPLVTDTMMNLELLFWASRNGGETAWNDMALRHALKTMTDMVRPDGSTFHVVDYNTAGGIRSRGTFQGYSDSSTWARGQAWAIYGFTVAYRYTRDPRMLQTAQRVTNYYLGRLPADGIPFWDFDAPADQQVKDSSAAAAVASALLELSEYVTEPTDKARYRNAALLMLETLASPAYLTSGTSTYAILNHGVGHYPAGQEIDVGLIYGDYYFIEATLRFKALSTSRVISFGGTWKYDDRNVDPGPQWMTPAYNDSAWRSGPGQLGYGDGDEATRLTKTAVSQPSVYFRRHVNLAGPVTQAALRVLHDDGVAVWVNGTLVFSKYVARGTSHGVYASASSLDNEISTGSIPVSPSPFREGDNVIAVMIKQSDGGSSDISFDLELTVTTAAPSGPRVTVVSPNGGESLHAGSTHSILWSSAGSIANVRLELSTDNGTTWQTITGSAPNTGQYEWTVPAVNTSQARIRISDVANPAVSDISDAVFAIVTETVITPIVFGATWRYDDRGVDPGSSWRTLGFNDTTWKVGPGQLGYGDGDEATRLVRTSPAQPSVYFRKKISLSGPVSRADLRVLHDDGVAVWVNGTLVFSKYVANGTSHSAYASSASLDNEVSSALISSSAFVPGENIIAVMVKQSDPGSSDVSFDMALTLTVGGGGPPPEETVVPIPPGSVWKYDDAGVDRGTAWLALGYDDAAWRSGPAQLGYGDGDEATVLRASPVAPSYYFRRRFFVDGQVTQAQLRTVFDDAVAVWVNGRLVFSRNMGNGTGFSAFASANSADNEVADATLDLTQNPFVPGDNVVSVMVKQAGSTSSDVSFDLSLTLRIRR
jgi:lysophospholipase L1-like esterase